MNGQVHTHIHTTSLIHTAAPDHRSTRPPHSFTPQHQTTSLIHTAAPAPGHLTHSHPCGTAHSSSLYSSLPCFLLLSLISVILYFSPHFLSFSVFCPLHFCLRHLISQSCFFCRSPSRIYPRLLSLFALFCVFCLSSVSLTLSLPLFSLLKSFPVCFPPSFPAAAWPQCYCPSVIAQVSGVEVS